ncbi:Signal peptidase I [hydrothermal vent metagenome]|uniref:signal peptidase I n=1 Tax=hydrothermal vent metagenome TaxID=652676 RepID=A0A3B0UPT4_9ZZZZ
MNEIHFDFEAFLTITSLATGLLWIISKYLHKKGAKQSFTANTIEQVGSFFPVLIFVLVIRTFVFEPFRIPSSSMMPTLLTGDFIYVNKFAYGLKMPVLHDTIIEVGKPKRGDIIVFRFPQDQSSDYIKRVVALPGDRVFYDTRKKEVFINGKLIQQQLDGPYTGLMDNPMAKGLIKKYESLGDVNHMIFTQNHSGGGPIKHLNVTVPAGHYFVLGDNRDNSADSRAWGFVPERNLVGRAVFIWMHWRTTDFIEGLKRIGTKLI